MSLLLRRKQLYFEKSVGPTPPDPPIPPDPKIYTMTWIPEDWSTTHFVGIAMIDQTVGSDEVPLIQAEIRPGFGCDAGPENTDLYADGNNRHLILFIQGVGYDASNNAIAATPTYVFAHEATTSQFSIPLLVSLCRYTPNGLNITYEGATHNTEYTYESASSPGGYVEKQYFLGAGGSSLYYPLELSAQGLQKMEVYITPHVVTYSGYAASGYTFSDLESPGLFDNQATVPTKYEAQKWAAEGWGNVVDNS